MILAAGAWGATRGRTTPDEDGRRRQMHGDRDKLFAALAALEAQRRKGIIDAHGYASRRADLVTDLEGLYAQLE